MTMQKRFCNRGLSRQQHFGICYFFAHENERKISLKWQPLTSQFDKMLFRLLWQNKLECLSPKSRNQWNPKVGSSFTQKYFTASDERSSLICLLSQEQREKVSQYWHILPHTFSQVNERWMAWSIGGVFCSTTLHFKIFQNFWRKYLK